MSEEGFELVKNSLSRNRRATNLVGQVTPTQQEVDELYDERITPETDLPPILKITNRVNGYHRNW